MEAFRAHLPACPVRLEVRAAEGRAGRKLSYKEMLAVRDRARHDLKEQKESLNEHAR
jgi:hypothetical protein